MMPLLSIIIPAYNSEKYISHTLSMLVAQVLDSCEVIVVNDGSIDNTGKICTSFATNHNNIRLISLEKNSGVSVARNMGLVEAKGKYVCFFDSDDDFLPDTLSFFKETIIKQNTKYRGTQSCIDVFCFGSEARRNGKKIRRHVYRKYSGTVFSGSFDFLKLILEKRIHCSMDSALISRKLLQSNRIVFRAGMAIGEDLDFLIRTFACSQSVYYNSRICYVYYIRENSTTKGYKSYSVQQFNTYTVISKYLQELIAKNGYLSKQGNFYLVNLYIANLYFYLKSDIRDNDINQLFLENRKIVYKNYTGQMFRLWLFSLCKIIPIRLLFCIFRKYHI
jgi:UDP-glucose:(glucosyl)LPS beta-1,3-glucosyltransferase